MKQPEPAVRGMFNLRKSVVKSIASHRRKIAKEQDALEEQKNKDIQEVQTELAKFTGVMRLLKKAGLTEKAVIELVEGNAEVRFNMTLKQMGMTQDDMFNLGFDSCTFAGKEYVKATFPMKEYNWSDFGEEH